MDDAVILRRSASSSAGLESSGIDTSHPAFLDTKGECRVQRILNFTKIRDIVSLNNLRPNHELEQIDRMTAAITERAPGAGLRGIDAPERLLLPVLLVRVREKILEILHHDFADLPHAAIANQLPRVPDVVIMSACELGRSTSRWGLESLGMARAWLHAGARSVLASPASIADENAATLLPAVHRELARGCGLADALTAATEATGVTTPLLARGSGW